jgi:hypothetical protein
MTIMNLIFILLTEVFPFSVVIIIYKPFAKSIMHICYDWLLILEMLGAWAPSIQLVEQQLYLK